MVKCITSVELFGKVYKYYNDGKSLLLDYNLSLSNIISYSENENYMENRVIYNKLSEREIANSIMVGDNKLQLNKIYEVVAQLFNN